MPPPPGISITRRSPAGTTCKPFGFSSRAGLQRHRAAPAGTAAVAAAGGKLHPFEPGEDAEGGVLAGADFHDLAQAAAILAGAAGILAQLLAPDDQRRDRLGRLHRHVAHAGGERRRRQPVLAGPRAGAAGMEAHDHERGAGLARPTPVRPWPAISFRLQRLEVPSAGTRPGIACSRRRTRRRAACGRSRTGRRRRPDRWR